MSDKLFRISTPTIKYTIDDEFDMSRVASSRFIICNMGNKNLIVKENPVIEDMSFKVNLTQEDTKKLNAGIISAQIHILLNNHKVIWTDIAKTTMNGVLGEDMFDVPDYSADTGEYEIDFHGTVSDYDVPLHGHLDVTLEGSTVIPNPEGEATDDLTKVEIDGEIFLVKDSTIHDWARTEEKPTYTKAEVGLGNVDNTSDLEKPVSTAIQAALDLKADSSSVYTKTESDNLLNGKADKSNTYTKSEVDSALDNKVDKVEGKGLSENDYDDTAKGIVDGVTTALLDKVDKEEGKGLSSNDYTDTEKALVGTIEDKLDKTETAVNSNGLVIATPVTDTAPYIYRQTPVKESFKALMKKIVGASVVWNQIIGDTSTIGRLNCSVTYDTSTNKFSITQTTDNAYCGLYTYPTNKLPQGHCIYISAKIKTSQNVTFATGLEGSAKNTSLTANTETTVRYVGKDTNQNRSAVFYLDARTLTGLEAELQASVIDLTAMFGTTIADYVYTLETSQSGSGIAWLQSYGFFTEDYYAYKQNKLESGCVSAKKIVGFNQFDEQVEQGGYDENTGEKIVANVSNIRSVSPIRVFPSTAYYFYYNGEFIGGSKSVGIYEYKADGSFIKSTFKYVGGFSITLTSETHFINFRIYDSGVTAQSQFNKICINISNAQKNGTYEPYTETTYPISPITLRGLFKLSTDKLTVDGDEYNADGSVTRKYGIVDLGTLTYSYESATTGTYGRMITTSLSDVIVKQEGNLNFVCPKFIALGGLLAVFNSTDGMWESSVGNLSFTSAGYTDAQTFKTAMSGVYLIYPLATPTTEQTTPFTETEIVGSTEEFIDYEVAQDNRDVAIPVGTETDYYQEMKLPSLPTTSGNHNLIYNPSTGFGWS